jgi:hypothetical protein
MASVGPEPWEARTTPRPVRQGEAQLKTLALLVGALAPERAPDLFLGLGDGARLRAEQIVLGLESLSASERRAHLASELGPRSNAIAERQLCSVLAEISPELRAEMLAVAPLHVRTLIQGFEPGRSAPRRSTPCRRRLAIRLLREALD